MTEEIIPGDVKLFLLQSIDSIAHWEGLLIFRSERGQRFTASGLATRLYIPEAESERIVGRLVADGFLNVVQDNPPSYQYCPKNAELEEMVSRTAGLYKEYLIPITHIIHSKPKNRIQEFADAFRVRKEK